MSHYKAYAVRKASGVEWLGQVPMHWGVIPFKWLADIRNGKDYKYVEVEDSGFPVIGSGGEFARASQYLFNGEAVLLGRKGTIDRPLYINGPFWTVDTMFYTVIGPKVVAKYIYYCSLTIQFDRYSTNTALPSMTQEVLGQILFAVPEIREQCEIVTHLDRETARIDSLVNKKTRFIELLCEKRQALITHAVTKGLGPNVMMKDSGVEWLAQVPAYWQVKKLKYLCKIQTGDKDTVNAEDEGQYPFFVRSQTIERINSYTKNCEAVLTAGDGVGVGKVFHYFEGKFDFHQRVYMLNRFSEITGRFFFYYLQCNFHKVALDGGAKSTVDSLRLPVFLNFQMTVPPLDEQVLILDFIEMNATRIDTLIIKTERSIELLKERRSALITAAVTGQIDLREEQHESRA